MILGIGIDIVQARRIENLLNKHGETFLNRILTENEIALIPEKRKTEFIAGRFAVKEAIIKAAGKSTFGIRDIEILHDAGGKPCVANEKKLLGSMGIEGATLHISISHDGDVAVGLAILENIC